MNRKICILDDEKECDGCLECEVCDNCGKCLDIKDYAAIKIDKIYLDPKAYREK